MRSIRQGDLLFVRVEAVPAGAVIDSDSGYDIVLYQSKQQADDCPHDEVELTVKLHGIDNAL